LQQHKQVKGHLFLLQCLETDYCAFENVEVRSIAIILNALYKTVNRF